MAFNTIPDSLIQVGKSITRTLFKTYVKDNLDDLDTRVNAVEANVAKIIVFDDLVLNAANLVDGGSIEGLDVFRAAAPFTLTDAKVSIFTKGTLTGTLEIDVVKSSNTNFSGASSVFTTKPSIAMASAANYEESSNAVFDNAQKTLAIGEYLRLDVSQLPSNGPIGKFVVYLIGEPA